MPLTERGTASTPGIGSERTLSGFGRSTRSVARVVVAGSACVLPALVRDPPGGVLARGGGCSYGDAAQNRDGRVIDMRGLSAIMELDDAAGELTAQAGATIGQLLRFVLPRGWMLPVVPGTKHVTLGGAIASDVHGKNHHRDGSLARHLRSIRLCTASGELVELTPEEDPEGFAATVGGMGLTGVVLSARLTLLPVAGSALEVDTLRTRDLADTLAQLEQGADRRYSVAWLDLLDRARPGRGILTVADHVPSACSEPAGAVRPPRLAVPRAWPGGLNRRAVALLNDLRWRSAPRAQHGRSSSVAEHLFPLDRIAHWNRLYGPRGMLQYQFVVPLGAERVLEQVLLRLRDDRAPAYLGVLKRLGPSSGGPLSFAIEGHTLAIDLPALPRVRATLDRLDELVLGGGGRIYLTKDARLSAVHMEAMYPQIDRWREARAVLDPADAMRSDLGRRLGLCAA